MMRFLTFRERSRRSVGRIETDRMTRSNVFPDTSRRVKTIRRTDRYATFDPLSNAFRLRTIHVRYRKTKEKLASVVSLGSKNEFLGGNHLRRPLYSARRNSVSPRNDFEKKGWRIAWHPGSGRTFKKHTSMSWLKVRSFRTIHNGRIKLASC